MSGEKTLGSRLIGLFAYLLGVIALAGVVHIVSVLAMPRVAPRDAFTRIAALAPIGRMTLLDPVTPSFKAFTFEDPATAIGACRYDLERGPLHILAALQPDRMMLFSFHSRFGQVFYSMSDRVASRGRLDVLVLTTDQLDAYEASDTGDELPPELRIVSPSREGFLLVRAFADQPSDLAIARDEISAMNCSVVQAPQS